MAEQGLRDGERLCVVFRVSGLHGRSKSALDIGSWKREGQRNEDVMGASLGRLVELLFDDGRSPRCGVSRGSMGEGFALGWFVTCEREEGFVISRGLGFFLGLFVSWNWSSACLLHACIDK